MNVSVYQTTWQGLEAWALESETLRTVVIPQLGAKLVSLLDKRNQFEWLVDSGDRPLKPVPYGANFVDQDMSGWDEMFPTIVACEYPAPGEYDGTQLPDHGEAWALPWSIGYAQEGSLSLCLEGKALPYRMIRTLSYSSPATLQMYYELENLSQERMPYIWAAHPQFVCGEQAEILLPPQVTQVCNTIPADWGWGEPETRFNWPEALSVTGQKVRIDRTGPSSRKQARKFFLLPETRAAWAGLVHRPSGDWLCLNWDPEQVPYLGIWIDEGALSHATVAALEPTTGFYDSLKVAWDKKEVTVLEPGEKRAWDLVVQAGTGEDSFPLRDKEFNHEEYCRVS
jgi:galactose mutarotase-like enzyme